MAEAWRAGRQLRPAVVKLPVPARLPQASLLPPTTATSSPRETTSSPRQTTATLAATDQQGHAPSLWPVARLRMSFTETSCCVDTKMLYRKLSSIHGVRSPTLQAGKGKGSTVGRPPGAMPAGVPVGRWPAAAAAAPARCTDRRCWGTALSAPRIQGGPQGGGPASAAGASSALLRLATKTSMRLLRWGLRCCRSSCCRVLSATVQLLARRPCRRECRAAGGLFQVQGHLQARVAA